MSTLASQPAFPGTRGTHGYGDDTMTLGPDGSAIFTGHNQGMTLRQHYAGLAMQGLMSNIVGIRAEGFKDSEISEFAVMQADALIAELSKPQPTPSAS
jgi:hypothetical protein